MTSNPMDIGALLRDDSAMDVQFASRTACPPKGVASPPLRLPGMETLLRPPPREPRHQHQHQRHQHAQSAPPRVLASTSPSPTLSHASTAKTSSQPPTPPSMAAISFSSSFVPANPSPRHQQQQQLQQQQPQQQQAQHQPPQHQRRESVGSRRTAAGLPRPRREHRPTYAVEEEHFIWYHRIDLDMDWHDIRRHYSAQFPHRVVRGHQGIQCKYYRCTEAYGIPKCRARSRSSSAATSLYGLRAVLPDTWYSWMREPRPAKAAGAK